jgi:hypothetical protein
MERQLSRLAVVHVGLIVYIIFSATIFLKIRYSAIDPFQLYDTPLVSYVKLLKSCGFLLFILPAAWSFWSFWQLRQPAGEPFSNLYLGGVVIAFGLVFVAVSTCLGLVGGSIIKVKEEPRANVSEIKPQEKPRTNISGSRFDTVEPAQKP